MFTKVIRDALSFKRRATAESAAAATITEPTGKRTPPAHLAPLHVSSAPVGMLRMCSKHPHALALFTNYTASCCDICNIHLVECGQSTAWRCDACDFDVCERCLNSNAVPLALATPRKAGSTAKSPTSNKNQKFNRIPDELFSPKYLSARLYQLHRGAICDKTRGILDEQELDLLLIRRLERQGLEDLGISDTRELDILLNLAHTEYELALTSTDRGVKSRVPEELFSFVWFCSRLTQSKCVCAETLRLLGENEVDLILIKRLGDEGLQALGVSSPQERAAVLQFAGELEASLT